jgi:ABC-2 type transport system permease protein
LSLWQIVNGKFLGAVLLIVMAIIPTFILCRSNLQSGNAREILTWEAPLVLMLGCYSWLVPILPLAFFSASTLSDNQIVAL